MSSSQKIRRVQLKLNQNPGSALTGIVSSEPDYRLSLQINRKLNISLKNVLPLRVTPSAGTETSFSRFSDMSSPHGHVYDLVANRNEKCFLIRKLKNIDYFLKIQNAESEKEIEKIISALREMDSVTAVFNIDEKSVKDKNLSYLMP
jgi:hypothetical protein